MKASGGMGLTKKSMWFTVFLCLLIFVASFGGVVADEEIYVTGIAPSSVYPHDSVHVQGGGATPQGMVVATLTAQVNSTIFITNPSSPWIFVGSEGLNLASASAGDSGNWSIDFSTPLVYPGDYLIRVTDNNSMASAAVDFRVLMNLTIVPGIIGITNFSSVNMTGLIRFLTHSTVFPSSGPSGTLVTVSGTTISSGGIAVYFDNMQVATVVGPSSGYWVASFQVPNTPVGNHTIRALDSGAGWMSVNAFYVSSSPFSLLAIPSLMLLGLFALALISGLAMLVILAAWLRKRHSNSQQLRS